MRTILFAVLITLSLATNAQKLLLLADEIPASSLSFEQRERLDTVERWLEEKKILTSSEIDRYQPPESVEAIRAGQRAQFIETLLRVIEAEFEEITRPDMPGSREEILKSLT